MLIRIHPENPSPRHIKMVVECLSEGGIIVYPTDTVYGLACNIYKSRAFERIAQIKGIKKEKANFTLVFTDLSQLSEFTKPVSNEVFRLMRSSLPGPYTFILNASSNVPKIFQSRKKTLGIRIPENNIAQEIVRELGNPIMTTSIHDDDDIIEYTTDPELIYEKYKDIVDIVVDGGYGDNVPSTIVDCTGPEPMLVREGKGIL